MVYMLYGQCGNSETSPASEHPPLFNIHRHACLNIESFFCILFKLYNLFPSEKEGAHSHRCLSEILLLLPCEKILTTPYQLRILDEDIYH